MSVSLVARFRYHARFLELWRKSAGLLPGLRYEWLGLRRALGIAEPLRWRVHPRPLRHPITLRLQGSSDMAVFQQILLSREYACLRGLNPGLILDLGANIGLSSADFLSRSPGARVLAVEPDESNLELCRTNLAPYGHRALVLHGAVWSHSTRLQLSRGSYGDGREWATQVCEADPVSESESTSVQAWDIPTLIEMAGGGIVDLLKIDIERAELALFSASAAAWLPNVRNICIELHGRDCEQAFFAALRNFDYFLQYSGELIVCREIRLKRSLVDPSAYKPGRDSHPYAA